MSLPPLANVFALRSENPSLLDSVEKALLERDHDGEVRRPSTSWVVARESVPAGPLMIRDDATTFFTEGADLFHANQMGAITKAAMSEPSSLARHEGDFGFLHITSGENAMFVRSCGGRVPVYIRRGNSYVALSTRLTDLVAFTPDNVALDPLVCAIWAMGWDLLPDNRTFFRDVSCVPRAHVATIGIDGRVGIHRYWDPRPHTLQKPTEDRRRMHVERCRTLLVDYLSRELDPNGHNLLTLSGGVDSSSLAALAAGTLGYPVSTLSFLPSEEPNRSREMTYIENLRATYPFESVWELPIDLAGRIDAAGSAPAVAFPVVHPALGVLSRVVEERRVDVLFGGEFADHVCGSPYTFPDWMRHTSLLQLARSRAEWPQGRRTVPRWCKHRAIDLVGHPFMRVLDELSDFVLPAVRDEYRQWKIDRRRALADDNRPLRYLAMAIEQDGSIAMNWEVTTALGVRRAWPFFNRGMLELAFDCHPWELVGRETKYLLRSALARDVPAMNLHRQTRGHWRPPPETLPTAPAVHGLEAVFDVGQLSQKQAELGLPVSWWFKGLLDSVREMRRSPAPGQSP